MDFKRIASMIGKKMPTFPNGGGLKMMQSQGKHQAKLKEAAAKTLQAKHDEEWVKHEAKFAPKPPVMPKPKAAAKKKTK